MNWSEVISLLPKKVVEETRAGLIYGVRVELSRTPAVAAELLKLDARATLWIVDDLQGMSDAQPMVFGVPLLEVFGLEGDHKTGVSLDELRKQESDAAAVWKSLVHPKLHGAPATHFVWSGPLCGGRLVKGVFSDAVRDGTRWYESDQKLCTFEASRGANQDAADGGVFGVELFGTVYDNADDPPVVTSELLARGDAELSNAGLLASARLFALPHYD